MSYITNVIITGVGFDQDELILITDHLNKLTAGWRPWMHVDTSKVGGQRSMEVDILMAAFNYLDRFEFVDNVKGLKELVSQEVWEDLQVMLLLPESSLWNIYKIEELTVDDLW